jgi:hypothetical protein
MFGGPSCGTINVADPGRQKAERKAVLTRVSAKVIDACARASGNHGRRIAEQSGILAAGNRGRLRSGRIATAARCQLRGRYRNRIGRRNAILRRTGAAPHGGRIERNARPRIRARSRIRRQLRRGETPAERRTASACGRARDASRRGVKIPDTRERSDIGTCGRRRANRERSKIDQKARKVVTDGYALPGATSGAGARVRLAWIRVAATGEHEGEDYEAGRAHVRSFQSKQHRVTGSIGVGLAGVTLGVHLPGVYVGVVADTLPSADPAGSGRHHGGTDCSVTVSDASSS